MNAGSIVKVLTRVEIRFIRRFDSHLLQTDVLTMRGQRKISQNINIRLAEDSLLEGNDAKRLQNYFDHINAYSTTYIVVDVNSEPFIHFYSRYWKLPCTEGIKVIFKLSIFS